MLYCLTQKKEGNSINMAKKGCRMEEEDLRLMALEEASQIEMLMIFSSNFSAVETHSQTSSMMTTMTSSEEVVSVAKDKIRDNLNRNKGEASEDLVDLMTIMMTSLVVVGLEGLAEWEEAVCLAKCKWEEEWVEASSLCNQALFLVVQAQHRCQRKHLCKTESR